MKTRPSFAHLATAAATAAIALLLAGCASDGGLRPHATPGQPDQLAASASLADTSVSPAAWPAANWNR